MAMPRATSPRCRQPARQGSTPIQFAPGPGSITRSSPEAPEDRLLGASVVGGPRIDTSTWSLDGRCAFPLFFFFLPPLWAPGGQRCCASCCCCCPRSRPRPFTQPAPRGAITTGPSTALCSSAHLARSVFRPPLRLCRLPTHLLRHLRSNADASRRANIASSAGAQSVHSARCAEPRSTRRAAASAATAQLATSTILTTWRALAFARQTSLASTVCSASARRVSFAIGRPNLLLLRRLHRRRRRLLRRRPRRRYRSH